MARIVAGTAKGRTIKVPQSGTRPTSERAREGLFSRLDHLGYIRDCAVLDLFAGSGAIGLEAASRGARHVTCVDAAQQAAKVIEANARELGLDIDVVNLKAETYLSQEPSVTYDLAVLDPPYDFPDDDVALVLAALVPHLEPDAMVVVERSKKSPEPRWPDGLRLDDERKWGDTRVWSAVLDVETTKVEA